MFSIYLIDMEGGASTLIVTPMGQSILIDTGSLDPPHRDAERILQACTDANLTRIDYLITTHFDYDHYGAVKEVSDKIEVIIRFFRANITSKRSLFNLTLLLQKKFCSGQAIVLKILASCG